MLKVVEKNYDDYILYNGLRMKDTPFANNLKNGNYKYFIITENDKFLTDFSIVEADGNEINLNIVLRANEVLDTIIDYCKTKYVTIKLVTCAIYDINIEEKYNVIKKELINDKLELFSYTIQLEK